MWNNEVWYYVSMAIIGIVFVFQLVVTVRQAASQRSLIKNIDRCLKEAVESQGSGMGVHRTTYTRAAGASNTVVTVTDNRVASNQPATTEYKKSPMVLWTAPIASEIASSFVGHRQRAGFVLETPLRRYADPLCLEGSPGPLPVRSYYSSLTAIGLLGTFFGIAVALRSLDPTQITDASLLVDNVGELVGAMKTAFDSSIAGVVAYLTLLLGHAIAIKRIREEQASCINLVNEISVLDSVEQKLLGLDGQAFSDAAKKTAEAAAALNSASQAADTSALAMKHSAEQLSAEAIGNAVGEQIRLVLTEQFMPVLEGMQASLEGWNSLRESVIEPMAEHVESLDDSVESLVESVEKVISEIAGMKAANLNLSNSIDSLNRLVKDDLGAAAELLNRAMREFSGAANDAARQFSEQWSNALSSSVEKLTQLSFTFGQIHEAVIASYKYTENTTALYTSQVQQNASAAAGLKQQLEATREASRSLREIANEVARQSTVFTEKSSTAAYQFFDTAGEEIAELTVQLRGLVEQIRHTTAAGQAVGSAARSTNQPRV